MLKQRFSTIHDLCADIWEQIFEYFEVVDVFMIFSSITTTIDQILYDKNSRFLFRGLTVGTNFKAVFESIPMNRIISLTFYENASLEILERGIQLRSLKLIGQCDWIVSVILNISCKDTKLTRLTIITPMIESLSKLLLSTLHISSLYQLHIQTDELVKDADVCTLTTIRSNIKQLVFNSDSTIDWNTFFKALPTCSSVRSLSIGLIDRYQMPVSSFAFHNLHTLCLELLEVSFDWIAQFISMTKSLVKLKLTGLVNADGFVSNQRWIYLFELVTTLRWISVDLPLEKSYDCYDCEEIQAPLCALNLNLLPNGNNTDFNSCYEEEKRWWRLSGTIMKQHSYLSVS